MAPDSDLISDGADELEFKPLTAEEARILMQSSRPMSPWRIVSMQILVGVALALIVWAMTGSRVAGWSAAYGALAVVFPAVIFARGLARQQRVPNAGSALGGFFVWEGVKIVLTIAMLFAAPRLILGLNWLALLAGFVVTMKVYWVAMWLHSAHKESVAKIH